ncbi:porin [Inhella sp.]|uniref:porin n=1 Tax=Inhella sp. TaxID=1921806 RepID=UPI0035B3C4B0
MQNKIRFTALAAFALLAGAAQAQSSVTVYGRINLSVENQKVGSASAKNVLQNNSSRWGLKGSEDMGGGLKAGFQLESGLSADTGAAAATYWGRQAEVNLSGSFGTLRLGQMTSEAYYATADYISNHNHDTGTSSDALYAYVGRNSNKIAYRLPSMAQGMSLELATSLKEGGANNSYDVAWNYTVGGLQLGAGYEKNGDATQAAFRAFYMAGNLGFGGYLQRDDDAWSVKGSRTNVRLVGMYVAGANEFHLNVGRAGKVGSVNDSDATQYTLGINHNLSKRTKLYAFFTKVDDGKAGVYGGDFRSVAGGLRHNF